MSVIEAGLQLVFYSLQASWTWLTRIFVSSGALSRWFGMFFTYSIWRFFILPLFGASGSDKAGKAKKGVDDE